MPYKNPADAAARRAKPENRKKAAARTAKWHSENERNPAEHSAIQRRYRGKNLEACRDSVRRSQYSIPHGWYEQTLAKQKGVCAVCEKPCSSGLNLAVDHDHRCCASSGRSCGFCVRGLLCRSCNHLLGNAKDSPRILANAITYLAMYTS